MWNISKKFYDYLITFPERLYPFTERNLQGEKLTGERAYKFIAEKNKLLYMDAYSLQAPKLILWRTLFHVLGSILCILVADSLIDNVSFFNGFAFLVLVVVCVVIQEFYLQPHYYKQKTTKGMIDFAAWLLPIVIYILV